MVDINLVRGRPALKVEFQASLAADLFNTLGLVMSAPSVEGFDQWAYATFAALPPTLKNDIEQVFILTQKSAGMLRRISKLPPNDPIHRDFGALVAWLNGFSEHDFRNLVQETLGVLSEHICDQDEQISTATLDDEEGLKTFFAKMLDPEGVEPVIRLIRNPAELKAHFISVITRFWEQFYRQEFQRTLAIMERSIEHHRSQSYGADFAAVFTAITGRRVPEGFEQHEDAERVIFMPSCHIGPYVIFQHLETPQPALVVFFNCRPTGAPEGDQTPAVQDLFPPLKALADETRLQILTILDGRELYAQEIVAQLDISQSAVSRHLKLMVAGGLLAVRKSDSMKYFSINQETLVAVADRLKGYRAKRN